MPPSTVLLSLEKKKKNTFKKEDYKVQSLLEEIIKYYKFMTRTYRVYFLKIRFNFN
jgi:hypothetical protein